MLSLAWLAYFSFGTVLSALAPMVNLVVVDLHLNYAQMGTVLGSWQLVYIFMSLLIGVALDRLGSRVMIGIGTAIIALSALLRSSATGYSSLLFAVAIFGIGGPTISIGLPKLVAVWFATSLRGRAAGIYQMGSSTGILFGLASVNSIFIPWLGSWRTVYLFFSVMAAAVSAAWWIFSREPPQPPSRTAGSTSVMKTLKSVRIRNSWVISFVGISSFFLSHGLTNWLPVMVQRTGLSPEDAGFYASVPSIIGIPSSLFLPALVAQGRRKGITALLLFIGGASAVVIGVSAGGVLVAALVLQGVATGAILPLCILLLMETPEIGVAYIGTVSGLFFALGEIGGFAGPFLMGVSVDLTGSFIPAILVIATFSMVTILPLRFLVKESSDIQGAAFRASGNP